MTSAEQATTPDWPLERDAVTGAALPLPPGWERLDAAIGALVVAVPAPAEGVFRPTLIVTVEAARTEGDITDYSAAVQRGVLDALDSAHLAAVDLWTWPDGVTGRRLTFAYRQPPHAVVLQQWLRIDGGIVTSVSGSCSVAQLEWATPRFETAVSGLRPARQIAAGLDGSPGAMAPWSTPLDEFGSSRGERLEEIFRGWRRRSTGRMQVPA